MIAKCFKIECLTNMHVGNGDVNYNIIDKEVEKDPILQTPTINASGVKGALREHFTGIGCECDTINEIFGKPQSKDEDSNQGKIKILPANLLALPMRATDGKEFFYYVSNKELINTFNTLNVNLGINVSISDSTSENTVSVEGKSCQTTAAFNSLVSNMVAIMSPTDFKETPLPVVARNKINNGKNLWYEEIVPHKSVFYFYAIAGDSDSELMKTFTDTICKTPVQFGGNASIGYGLTKITVIGSDKEEGKNE